MILGICSNTDILKVMRIIKIIIEFIRILVPIILIISLMIDYTRAVSNGKLDNAMKVLINKAVTAIIIFLIPTFVTIIFKLVDVNRDYYDCIGNATSEGIKEAQISQVQAYIDQAKKTMNTTDYNMAYNQIQKIKDEEEKQKLLNEISEIKEIVEINEQINQLATNYDKDLYTKVYNKIKELDDKALQNELLEKLEKISANAPLQVASGTKTESYGGLTYYVNIPENATKNMPLIMYLHGDGNESQAPSSPLYSGAKQAYGNSFPFIIVAPVGGMWVETSGRLAVLKGIIDEVCNEYSCDTSKIIIAGHSRGSIGTWGMVNNYPNLFYKAVPISCNATINVYNFTHTKIWAFCGNQGDDIKYYNGEMQYMVSSINKVGGTAKFTELDGQHWETPGKAFTKETLEWMIQ